MRFRIVTPLVLGCLAAFAASAHAAPDPQLGGGAYAVSAADGLWVADTPSGFAGIEAGGEQGIDGGPVQTGYVDAISVRCENDVIVVRELWNTSDLGFTGDPALGSAAITGSAPADGYEIRVANCENPSDADFTETELSNVPLAADVKLTATGNPTTFTVLGQDEDPIDACVEAIGGGGIDRTATGSATVGDVSIGAKDAWAADLSDVAAAGGAAGLTDGCWAGQGQSRARQRLLAALRLSHPGWARLLAHRAG